MGLVGGGLGVGREGMWRFVNARKPGGVVILMVVRVRVLRWMWMWW